MIVDEPTSSSTAASSVWTAERLQNASYRDLGSPDQVEERFCRHLLTSKSCLQALCQLMAQPMSSTSRDYSITIDVFDLIDADPILGHLLLRYPASLIPGE
jgi:hypothetical protein